MARTTYRLKNWRAYNRALIQRGSLTVWVSQEALDAWEYDGPNQHGGQFTYSDLAIETCLKLRLIYKLALRQSQGFVASIFQILGLDELPIPDYSTLSRRHDGLSVDLCVHQKDDPEGEAEDGSSPRHIVIDSTGLKVYGEGEPTHTGGGWRNSASTASRSVVPGAREHLWCTSGSTLKPGRSPPRA